MTEHAVNVLAKIVASMTGACPNDTGRTDMSDIDGWEPEYGCEKVCGNPLDMYECWAEWARDDEGGGGELTLQDLNTD